MKLALGRPRHSVNFTKLQTMLHKFCHLLFFACQIGDFEKAIGVYFQKNFVSLMTHLFNYAYTTKQMVVQLLHCIYAQREMGQLMVFGETDEQSKNKNQKRDDMTKTRKQPKKNDNYTRTENSRKPILKYLPHSENSQNLSFMLFMIYYFTFANSMDPLDPLHGPLVNV